VSTDPLMIRTSKIESNSILEGEVLM